MRFANVTSLLALFVALGGTSYAVATGSIGSKQIKNNSIRSADVRNSSLQASDFAGGQLPAGSQGPQGPQGSQGPPGSPDSPAQVLGKLSEVDGDGSGLDADTLDGLGADQFLANEVRSVSPANLDDMPGAKAIATTSQVISSSEQIALDTQIADIGGMYDAPADALVTTLPGTYVISGWINWGAESEGDRTATIKVNGVTVALATQSPTQSGSTRQYVTAITRSPGGAPITLSGLTSSQDSIATTEVSQSHVGFAGLVAQWVAP